MTFTSRIKAFLAREDGAATNDFIVLVSGILAVGIFVVAGIAPQIAGFADESSKIEPTNRMITQFVNAKVTDN